MDNSVEPQVESFFCPTIREFLLYVAATTDENEPEYNLCISMIWLWLFNIGLMLKAIIYKGSMKVYKGSMSLFRILL